MLRIFLTGKSGSKNIAMFYSDLNGRRLTEHRDMFMDLAKKRGVQLNTFQDVVDLLKGDQGKLFRTILPELTKLVKLTLTVPVTFCSSEVIFQPQSINNIPVLHSGQARLKHVALPKNMLQTLNMDIIANEFIKCTPSGRNTFLIKN